MYKLFVWREWNIAHLIHIIFWEWLLEKALIRSLSCHIQAMKCFMHNYHLFKSQTVQQDFQNFKLAVLHVAVLQTSVWVLPTEVLYSWSAALWGNWNTKIRWIQRFWRWKGMVTISSHNHVPLHDKKSRYFRVLSSLMWLKGNTHSTINKAADTCRIY